MIGTSWLMGKLFEIFWNSRTNSGRLPLSSLRVTESTRLVGLKYFLKWSRIFSGEHFPGAGFSVDSCFVARGKCLSSSLVDRRLIDLSIFYFKIFIFKKKLARSLILSRVFDNSFELAFWAICWSFKSYSSLNMTWSSHDWYNHVFSRIGNVSSVAEFI